MQAYLESNKGQTRDSLAPQPRQPQTNKIKQIMTQEELKRFADKVAEESSYTSKEVLTSDEVSRYMGISLSYLYKLTMHHKIPHYKPLGKMCYFNRVEVEKWLQSNRVATDEELNGRATAYCMKGGAL